MFGGHPPRKINLKNIGFPCCSCCFVKLILRGVVRQKTSGYESRRLSFRLAPLLGQGLRLPEGSRSPDLGGGGFVKSYRRRNSYLEVERRFSQHKMLISYSMFVPLHLKPLGANLGVSVFDLPPSWVRVSGSPRGVGALAWEGGFYWKLETPKSAPRSRKTLLVG